MSIFDSILISTALAANPSLRRNLRDLVGRLAPEAFADDELKGVERELVKALRLKEARSLPSCMPASGEPLQLAVTQLAIISGTIERFNNPALRSKVRSAFAGAIKAGKVVRK